MKRCKSMIRSPDGSKVRCQLRSGHEELHRFSLLWADAVADHMAVEEIIMDKKGTISEDDFKRAFGD